MLRSTFDRRWFLKGMSGAAAAATLPTIIPATAFGANEKIHTGHVGVGGQGMGNLGQFKAHAVAVCDVDKTRAAKAAKVIEDQGRTPLVFNDYRELLARKDIDAVVCSTPDHWHALVTIDACKAGKHVYCEKPLTLFIAEGRKMVQAARDNKVIVQTGSQQRSAAQFRRACELVRNGAIGKIQKVLVGLPGANHPKDPVPDSNPPPELDYDLWLGPAPYRPYNSKRVHYNFRFWWDYSGGQMTNFGAHDIDIGQWGLDMDASGPISAEGTAQFHPQKWHEVSESCRVTLTYANGVEMIVGQKQSDIPGGCTFVGAAGKIHVNRSRMTSDPAEIVAQDDGKAGPTRLYVSTGHHRNFLECIATGKLPICDVEIGHRTATCCHLANIAIRTGQKVGWDPVKEEITTPELAGWVTRPYRAPWTLG